MSELEICRVCRCLEAETYPRLCQQGLVNISRDSSIHYCITEASTAGTDETALLVQKVVVQVSNCQGVAHSGWLRGAVARTEMKVEFPQTKGNNRDQGKTPRQVSEAILCSSCVGTLDFPTFAGRRSNCCRFCHDYQALLGGSECKKL